MHGNSITGTGEHVPVISVDRKRKPKSVTGTETHNGFGWASLALGIGSFATWGAVNPILTILAAFTGLVLGVVGYNHLKDGGATNKTAIAIGILVSAGTVCVFIIASLYMMTVLGGL